MSLITVSVQTAEKVNPAANEDRFYRVYELPPTGAGTPEVLMQNGSQRTGRTGGQFRLPSKAGSTAADEMRRKINDGYTRTMAYSFQVDLDRVKQAKDFKTLGKLLDNIRGSSPEGVEDNPSFSWNAPSFVSTNHTAAPASAPTGNDAIDSITSRVQQAITLAVTDPIAAMVEMSELREMIDVTAERTLKMRSFFETLELLVADAVMGR